MRRTTFLLLTLTIALAAGSVVPCCAAENKCGGPIRDPSRTIDVYVWSWKALREENVVMQRREYSCGAAALATLVKYYWGDEANESWFLDAIEQKLTPAELRDRIKNGLSMTDLKNAAVARGYQATMGRRSLSEMTELKVPVIVRLQEDEFKHFVVFRGVLDNRVFLADSIRGNIRVAFCEFAQQWTDGVILVVAKPDADLPKNAPLALQPYSPVQPELQTVRRALLFPWTTGPLTPVGRP